MKIEIEKSELTAGLSMLKFGITNRPILPILEDIKVSILEGNILLMQTTNNNLSVTYKLEAKSLDGIGSFMLQGTAISLIEQLNTGLIKIELKDRIVIVSQGKNKYKFQESNSASEFPIVITPECEKLINSTNVTLEFQNFKESIIDIINFCSSVEQMPALLGILFELETGTLSLTCTDAHILSHVKISCPALVLEKQERFILPNKIVPAIKSLKFDDEFCSITFNDSNFCLTYGKVILSIRNIDENYPNYKNVIPSTETNKVIIDKSKFINSLKRLKIVANQTTNGTVLSFSKSKSVLIASDLDSGKDGMEFLEVDSDLDSGFVSIGFNSLLMSLILSQMKLDKVTLCLSNNEKGAIILNENSNGVEKLCLIMPTLLDNLSKFDYASILEL